MDRPDPLSLRAFALWLAGLLLAAFAWTEWVTVTQYLSNHIYLADAGIFDSLCNSPLHGRWMRSPVHWQTGVTQFAAHFTPIFLLITPFYLIADHVLTYLTFQNAGLVAAAIPLALWARDLTRDGRLALAAAALYLTNHFTGSIQLANHQEALAPLGIFTMFLACQRRQPRLYAAAFLWALCTKETLALVAGLYGVFLLGASRTDRSLRPWAWWTLGVSAAWWIFASLVIKYSGADIYAAAGNTPIARFHTMGDSMGAVALHLLTHPVELAARLFRRPVLDLLLSAGLLALVDCRTLILLVISAGLYGVADDALVRDLWYYYSYPALPFLFLGTVRGCARLASWMDGKGWRWGKGALLAWMIVVAVTSVLLPTRTDGLRRTPFTITDRDRIAAEIARAVPPDEPVAVQYELFNRVANRRVKLPLRLPFLNEVDWVLMDGRMVPADLRGPEKAAEREQVYRRLQSPEWTVDLQMDGYVVLKKRLPP